MDLGETLKINGFFYTPATDCCKGGNVEKYRFFISLDGKRWIEIRPPGEFNNIKTNPVKQTVKFNRVYPAHFIKFKAVSVVNHKSSFTVAELGVTTL